jgi:hypothetical protein
MKKFIQSLTGDEALRVLNDILNDNPDLTKTVYDTAMKVVIDVNADDIMEDVFIALNNLDIDDLNGRAGRTRYGYTEPSEAAWELFEETLDTFISEMKKHQKLSLPATAKTYCIGIVKGLWKYKKESTSDFSDWVEDAPGEFIDSVIDEWKKGNPSDIDIDEVMIFAAGDQS